MHVAIIPDGSRRYGLKYGLSVLESHQKGADKMEELLYWVKERNIEIITVYAMSRDNLKRTSVEVKHLFDLLKLRLDKLLIKQQEEDFGVRLIGNRKYWTKEIEDLEYKFQHDGEYNINLLITPDSQFGSEVTKEVMLLIRTGGMCRLSGLKVGKYTTICFIDKLFPELTRRDFDYIMDEWYPKQIQNYGT